MTLFRLSPLRLTGAVILILIAAGAVTTVALRDDSVREAVESTPGSETKGVALTVSVAHPSNIVWPVVITSSGAIAPWQEAAVNTELGGARLVEVLVDIGDVVSKGQLLARFDEAQVMALLEQQKATLVEANARLAEAVFNAERAKSLESSKALSAQEYMRATTAELAARAQVELAHARLKSQSLALQNTRVVAPDDGVIASRNAMLGAVGVPGTELFRLVRQNRLEWQAELTASAMILVKIGDSVEVQLPDGAVIPGKVRQLSPVIDTRTRTGIAYVALEVKESAVTRAGMFASGSIIVGKRAGLALATSAIVPRDGYEYVFVVDQELGVVSQRKVSTGRRFGNRIEVLQGVTVNDAIVENGGAFLTDGDRVRVVEGPATQTLTLGDK